MLSNQSNKTDVNQHITNYQEYSSFSFSDHKQRVETSNRADYNLNLELIIYTLDLLFFEMCDQSLGTAEVLILKGVWQNKTYSQIAIENNYSADYFTNVAAPKLFKKLSKLIKCRITKKNCRSLITKYILEYISTNQESSLAPGTQIKKSSKMMSKYYSNFKQKNNLLNSSFLKDAIFLAQVI
ncbi:hypothetical protein [Pleurocapsa sp. PCC 7319]|uniref:hypothetical protein n=1 Tax=Pleurocapsa sp. PCC 7319 TaxID=118161 RepID=UPI000348A6ED|nr:hypothetical protein [Pleurocapsa sp. PCC 7319]